jgi:hypothetical protein
MSSALESIMGRTGTPEATGWEGVREDLRKYGLGHPVEELTIHLLSNSTTSTTPRELTKQRSPADVIPALSGRWLGKFAKLGQMAVIQLFRKSPAWTCDQQLTSLPWGMLER